VASLTAAPLVSAVGATLTLDQHSGPAGTLVTATYTAPGCGVAATVAFSLDGIGGKQFGTTTMNVTTCSASLKFAVTGAAGAHQIFGYVPNSGAPVASSPFTILGAPPPTATPVPTPVATPTPPPTPTPTPVPTATPAAQAGNSLLGNLLVPGLIAIIALLAIALIVVLILARRNRPDKPKGDAPPGS
jgi:hypothetical protein